MMLSRRYRQLVPVAGRVRGSGPKGVDALLFFAGGPGALCQNVSFRESGPLQRRQLDLGIGQIVMPAALWRDFYYRYGEVENACLAGPLRLRSPRYRGNLLLWRAVLTAVEVVGVSAGGMIVAQNLSLVGLAHRARREPVGYRTGCEATPC